MSTRPTLHATLQADLTALIARFGEADQSALTLDLSGVLDHLSDALAVLEDTYPADLDEMLEAMYLARNDERRAA